MPQFSSKTEAIDYLCSFNSNSFLPQVMTKDSSKQASYPLNMRRSTQLFSAMIDFYFHQRKRKIRSNNTRNCAAIFNYCLYVIVIIVCCNFAVFLMNDIS